MRLRWLIRVLPAAFFCALFCFIGLFVRLHWSAGTDMPGANKIAENEPMPSVSVVVSAKEVKADSEPSLPTASGQRETTSSPIFHLRKINCTSTCNRIPHILHQTWISESIPATYGPFVRSWLAHKPPLSYFYWTDAKSEEFVARHYPRLLSMFKGYKVHLNRADAIRYMLLHHYGGIYADMDMMRLRDLGPLLNSTQELCYLSQERYEITRLYWGLNSSVMNAIMLSSPGHRFMEYVVNALPRYSHHSPNVMESTGPFFLQNVYNEFVKSPPCNLSDAACRCAVADPYMFMPQIDPIRIPLFRDKCTRSALAPNAQEACRMLDKIDWKNEVEVIGSDSYTHHGFLHYGFENQKLRFSSVEDINSIRKDKLTFGRDFQ